MNPAITKSTVARRPPLATAAERRAIARKERRNEDANSALRLSALRREQLDQANARAHRAALDVIDTIDTIDRTMALESATRPMATPNPAHDCTPQSPATMPPVPVVYQTSGFRPWPAVTALILGLTFIAGLAVGRSF